MIILEKQVELVTRIKENHLEYVEAELSISHGLKGRYHSEWQLHMQNWYKGHFLSPEALLYVLL